MTLDRIVARVWRPEPPPNGEWMNRAVNRTGSNYLCTSTVYT
jgi:hypothetical protein